MNQFQADAAARAVIEQKPQNLFDFLKTQYAADLQRGAIGAGYCKPLAWVFPDRSALLFYRGQPNSLMAFRSLDVALRCL